MYFGVYIVGAESKWKNSQKPSSLSSFRQQSMHFVSIYFAYFLCVCVKERIVCNKSSSAKRSFVLLLVYFPQSGKNHLSNHFYSCSRRLTSSPCALLIQSILFPASHSASTFLPFFSFCSLSLSLPLIPTFSPLFLILSAHIKRRA